jgi:hypothetical protein
MLTTALLAKCALLPAGWRVYCRPATVVCGPSVLPCVHQTSYDVLSLSLCGSPQERFFGFSCSARATAPCVDRAA